MPCTKETHSEYLPVAHAAVHEVAAEGVFSGIHYGRIPDENRLKQAIIDAEAAMEFNPMLADECARLLAVFVKTTPRPLEAAQPIELRSA